MFPEQRPSHVCGGTAAVARKAQPMSPDEKDLSELEQTLAGLRPAPAGFDRDQVMFQAGRAAAHARRGLLWPATAGLMSAVAACLGLFLVLRSDPEPLVRVVY